MGSVGCPQTPADFSLFSCYLVDPCRPNKWNQCVWSWGICLESPITCREMMISSTQDICCLACWRFFACDTQWMKSVGEYHHKPSFLQPFWTPELFFQHSLRSFQSHKVASGIIQLISRREMLKNCSLITTSNNPTIPYFIFDRHPDIHILLIHFKPQRNVSVSVWWILNCPWVRFGKSGSSIQAQKNNFVILPFFRVWNIQNYADSFCKWLQRLSLVTARHDWSGGMTV